MGSRGTSQFADLVLGSVANKVIQLAAKPVTLVP
jgi:nucleotide-binding universal stress UspA family protein